jgi:GST-like protein
MSEIELHYWNTPNGHKITMMLEECGLPYRIVPVDIRRNAQFQPSFLALSPNNKIPAILDPAPPDGGGPLSIFESGVILQYLADKTGRLLPSELRARTSTLQWLTWQVAGLGPMLGQLGHFRSAKEKLPYAIDRYTQEAARLYGVLERQLAGKEWVAGDYSIADIAIYPWIHIHEWHGIDLAPTPNVAAWLQRVAARPATARAYEKGNAAVR